MNDRLSRREFIARSALAAAGFSLFAERLAATVEKEPLWPFYAFDNGLGTIPTLEGKVKLLRDLGYVGLEAHWSPNELPGLLELLDKHGLQLNAIYTVPWLEDPIDPQLTPVIKQLKGRATRIELAIRSREFKKPSDVGGDARAVDMLRRLSDLCAGAGPVVSIYPHTGFWTERVDDGVRLASKVGRKNVGTNFNLVHWHWVRQTEPLEKVLREALPHLFSVTINNGRKGGREIYSLDKGDYDLLGFLRLVEKIGYRGPVGLQCYSVPGPSEEHLRRSMETWRKILEELGLKA